MVYGLLYMVYGLLYMVYGLCVYGPCGYGSVRMKPLWERSLPTGSSKALYMYMDCMLYELYGVWTTGIGTF